MSKLIIHKHMILDKDHKLSHRIIRKHLVFKPSPFLQADAEISINRGVITASWNCGFHPLETRCHQFASVRKAFEFIRERADGDKLESVTTTVNHSFPRTGAAV